MRRRIAAAGYILVAALFLSAGQDAPASKAVLLDYARASWNPGQIDIVAIPKPFNMVYEEDDAAFDGWKSHLPIGGVYELRVHRGTDHYLPYDYDSRVPIVLFGRPYIKPGAGDGPASLRDIVPSLCRILGIPVLPHAKGRVLADALDAVGTRHPKVILMFVVDQGGWAYLNAHPRDTPFVSGLMTRGYVYRNARIDHGPASTSVSHAVLGTGALPLLSGVFDNKPYAAGWGRSLEIYAGATESAIDTSQLRQPTLADVWDAAAGNAARVLVYSSASRAAVGLAGHGGDYAGGDKDFVFWYGGTPARFETDDRIYTLPPGVAGLRFEDYAAVNADDPDWRDQPLLDPTFKFGANLRRASPGFARMEGDAVETALRSVGGWGSDAVTDLIFLNFKGTDYAGHYMGSESRESGRTLREIDRQIERIFNDVTAMCGGDLVTVVTADHGVAPLTELSGGIGLYKDDLARAIDDRFSRPGDARRVVLRVYRNGLALDVGLLADRGFSLDKVKVFLRDFKVGGRTFFEAVYAGDDLRH